MTKTETCPACQGTQFTAKGLCRSCEYAEPACTRESHALATATLELFKSNLVNIRLWADDEFEINMLQGDCPACKSSLCWDFNEPPACFEPRGPLKHEVVAAMNALTAQCFAHAAKAVA